MIFLFLWQRFFPSRSYISRKKEQNLFIFSAYRDLRSYGHIKIAFTNFLIKFNA